MAQQLDVQNLMQGWMDAQQKLWSDWAQSMQGAGGGSAQPWSQGLTSWKEAVDKTLDTQKQATRAWAEQVAGVKGAPDEVKKWATDGVALVEQWSDAQHSLWNQWFELMSSAAPTAGNAPGADQMKQIMSEWEKAAGRMQDMQRQWVSSFSGLGGKKK